MTELEKDISDIKEILVAAREVSEDVNLEYKKQCRDILTKILVDRAIARKRKDFVFSDQVRTALQALGIIVEDRGKGVAIKKSKERWQHTISNPRYLW